MTHTPTPWQTGWDGSVRDANGNCIPLYSGFIAEAFYGEEPAISNAAFIVAAVNAYAKIEAMRPLIDDLSRFIRINEEMGRVVVGQVEATRELAEIFASIANQEQSA